MSRTLHTEPRARLAARRLAAPLARRADGPARNIEASASGEPGSGIPAAAAVDWARPRVVASPPRPSHHHPASRADVLRVLGAAGPEALYGLRAVELRQADGALPGGHMVFGCLRIPARILLFEQPRSPWRRSGALGPIGLSTLTRAGAQVAFDAATDTTTITWPDDTLRRFMLLDILLHEIGHHVLQHHHGKRLATVVRTRDHEAFADRYARTLRKRCEAAVASST
jgi:hypothetical protein